MAPEKRSPIDYVENTTLTDGFASGCVRRLPPLAPHPSRLTPPALPLRCPLPAACWPLPLCPPPLCPVCARLTPHALTLGSAALCPLPAVPLPAACCTSPPQLPVPQDQHVGGEQGVGEGVGEDGVFDPAAAVQRPGVAHACHRPGQPAAVQGAEEDRGHHKGQPGEPEGGQVIEVGARSIAGAGSRETPAPRRSAP